MSGRLDGKVAVITGGASGRGHGSTGSAADAPLPSGSAAPNRLGLSGRWTSG